MMKRFHKMVAAVMAVATLATSMVPLSADALYFNGQSKFAYDLSVDDTNWDDMVRVTFYTTYNPGVTSFSVALKYDTSKLEYVESYRDSDYESAGTFGTSNDKTKGMVIIVSATENLQDYNQPISYSYYFKPKTTSRKETYNFSACVYQYNSKTENILFGNNIGKLSPVPDEVTKKVQKGTYNRRIGDVIPDNSIDMSDVTTVLGIVSFLNDCQESDVTDTYDLNEMLITDRAYTLKSGKTGTYRERLKDSLYVDDVPFAEVADCDQNGKIEKADADLLITYYSQAASGQDPDSLINSKISKVVYADITT